MAFEIQIKLQKTWRVQGFFFLMAKDTFRTYLENIEFKLKREREKKIIRRKPQ